MAGKGGGAWKVAYADFVTAMMAFFLVMWIVAQNHQVREAVAQSFNDPFGHNEGGFDEHSKHPQHDERSHRPTPGEGKGHLLVVPPSDSPRSAIGASIPFSPESAVLEAEARQLLDHLVPLMAGKPQKIEVRGHCSRRPLAKGDHWQLSFERSLAVMHYLESRGIGRERIRLSQAAGNEPPRSQGDPHSGESLDRVDVNLLSETVPLPFAAPYAEPDQVTATGVTATDAAAGH